MARCEVTRLASDDDQVRVAPRDEGGGLAVFLHGTPDNMVVHAGGDKLSFAVGKSVVFMDMAIAKEIAARVSISMQSIDHDAEAEPVCDHCGQPVQPDDDDPSLWIHSKGGEWLTTHYTCAVGRQTFAMVNGSGRS